jgi:transglutaminase-like putative cysteine protease
VNRREFIKTAAILSTAALPFPALRTASAAFLPSPPPPWRVFEMTAEVEVLRPSGVTRVWLPLPLDADTDYQMYLGSTWAAPAGVAVATRDELSGAPVLRAEWPEAVSAPRLRFVSRIATRDRVASFSGKGGDRPREDAFVLKRCLAASQLVPIDGIVRDIAREIVKGAHGGDIAKARAIYDWIVDNTFCDPATRGCGSGDVAAMLRANRLGGKCADLNALFVGLARAAGIPARGVYGLRIAPSEYGYRCLGAATEDITRAQHCRAEFYAAGRGWVPVDPADVSSIVFEEVPNMTLPLDDELVSRMRERLFGSWEMNWLAFNTAQDVDLPGARDGRLGFFMYPHCETAQGRLDSLDPDGFRYRINASEIAEA